MMDVCGGEVLTAGRALNYGLLMRGAKNTDEKMISTNNVKRDD